MLKLKSLLKSNLFLFVVTIVFFAACPQDVFAASGSVFEKVRDKAASSLKDIKLVVYILAGFGLIGFSFMAIFNKISWKWFANIAISLFCSPLWACLLMTLPAPANTQPCWITAII